MSRRTRPTRGRRAARSVPFAILLLLLLAGPGAARAAGDAPGGSGTLRALGPDGEPGAACPLEHTDVSVEISGFVARVRVTQTFSNPLPEPIEAVYTFPLSQRGAVDALWMRTGDRTIRGEIHRREDARRIYERARDRGQVASLLDQERPNVFTQSLANLMPGAEVEIEIHYVETLEYEAGAFVFSFPTVVGPRFVPGAPVGRSGTGWAPDTDRVPDASRITPPVAAEGTRAGHDLAIEVDIDAGVPIRAVRSALHEVEVERGSDETRARVRLRRRDEIPNRDFVLRVDVAADEVRSGTLVHHPPGRDGYVTFVLVPPARVTPRSAAPKELVFVVDRSGSQRGLPLAKAKETLLWILDHMHPDDTFQVLDFGSSANRLFERPRRATPRMKAEARRYIEALQAGGGTMMAEAVRAAAAEPADGRRLRIVTFMTDGYVGNDFQVLDLVRSLRGTSRWFPFGTGNSVNRFLLDQMALEGGGEVEYVLLDRPGEEVARRFWERIASPVLTDVRLDFQGLDVYDVFPGQVSDVWAEKPLVVHARYRGAGRGRVVLTGNRGGEPYREVLDVRLPARARSHDAIRSVWGRAAVGALMRRDWGALQTGTFPETLREEIVERALDHQLVTQFTSFVAVEDRVVNRGGEPVTVPVPVEMPQRVTYEGVFGAAPEAELAESGRMAAKRSPASQRGIGGPLRALGYFGDARQEPGPPVRRYVDVDRISKARGGELSREARERLAPPLRALLDGAAPPVPALEIRDGAVRVKVLVERMGEALRERLEAAGLRVTRTGDAWAVGWIEVADLGELAGVEGVRRVALP